jgi:8-oxo-dGTP diphosphatase
MTTVVCGLVERDGLLLIGQRRPDASHPLKWEFPGGKMEPGESPEEALARELREELAIEAGPIREIHRHEFAYPGKKPVLLIFLHVDGFTGEPLNQVFNAIAWSRPGALASFDFLEGDVPFLTWLASSDWFRKA